MNADTTRDAVERLAEHITRGPHEAWEVVCATTLRALLAERDAARADAARLRDALAGLLPTARHYGGLRDCDLEAINTAKAALAGGKHD
jgi:hypothetical protein